MRYNRFGAAVALALLGLSAEVNAELPQNVPLPPLKPAEIAATVTGSYLAEQGRSVEITTPGADQAGSGLLLNERWVLSALHVAILAGSTAQNMQITMVTVNYGNIRRRVLLGDIVMYHPQIDLVLIKLRKPFAGITPVRLAQSVTEGEECHMYSTRRLNVWASCRLQATLKRGETIGKDGKETPVPENFRFTSFLATTGDSGSAVYNNKGELQGVLRSIAAMRGMTIQEGEDLITKSVAARLDKDFQTRFQHTLRNIVVDIKAIRRFLCEGPPPGLELATCKPARQQARLPG